jgi:hypothetical protein
MSSDEDGHPRGDGDPEWEYGAPKPGSGDSHEDEFDEEYGEQRPHGDPNRPDTSGWDRQYGGEIDYWEEVARQNEMAQPLDPAAAGAALADPMAKSFDPAASAAAKATAYNPTARPFEADARAAADATAYDPDDFDRAETVVDVGPPIPRSAVAEPDPALISSVDSAVPYSDVFADTSVSASPPLISSERFDPGDSSQPVIVDPVGSPMSDSAVDESVEFRGLSSDSAVPYADSSADSSSVPFASGLDDDVEAPVLDTAVEFSADIPEQTGPTDYIG